MRRSIRAVAWGLALCSANALAHEDTPLAIASDGTVTGLPAAYGPATLKLGFVQVEGERRVGSLSLAVRRARVEIPPCVLGLLETGQMADVRLDGSWDHDESVVPYYLSLKLFDPGYDPKAPANPGFSLLFDLRSARLIEMTVEIARPRQRFTQSVPVDLRARCGEAEAAAFMAGRSAAPEVGR